jgi:hypothetical protein
VTASDRWRRHRGATPLARLFVLTVMLVACTYAWTWAARPASAHNSLESTTPAAGSTVDRPPDAVTLTFDEPVGQRFGVVVVTGPDGKTYQRGSLQVSGSTATQPLQGSGPAGRYRVAWRVVSADGHPISGEFSFRVRQGSSGQSETPESEPPGTASESSRTQDTDARQVASDQSGGQQSAWPWVGLVGGVGVVGAVVGAAVWARRRRAGGPDR